MLATKSVSSGVESEKRTADQDNQNNVSDDENTSAIYEHFRINVISKETVANDFEIAADYKEIQSTVIEPQGEKNPEKKSPTENVNDLLVNPRNKTLTKKLPE